MLCCVGGRGTSVVVTASAATAALWSTKTVPLYFYDNSLIMLNSQRTAEELQLNLSPRVKYLATLPCEVYVCK